ncbi:MAG TPA: hypothetical protein VFO93_01880 [Hymenobacter sp.]|uniref:hypothetical protein n=1 Tax=Hymenobacter sp. TaxID=1898978 RepID=UPI002D80D4E5|nr:hypothetical protein [Hymenobacter sp.]HET9502260.1 hypothetical protein [Hymenobacter sp.]
MPENLATLVVETSFRVPGLGVLVVPAAGPAATSLAAHALHTALALRLLAEGQPPLALTGTIEELTHEGQPPRRTLLLDFDPGGPLPAGTRLRLEAVVPPLF